MSYPNHYTMKVNRLKVLEKHKGKCAFCKEAAFIVHHRDGSMDNHDMENLLPLCASCHAKLHHADSRSDRVSRYGNYVWDGAAIEAALMHRGMDKGELAALVGVSRGTLSHVIQNGRTKNSTMRKIAQALDYPITAFVAPQRRD